MVMWSPDMEVAFTPSFYTNARLSAMRLRRGMMTTVTPLLTHAVNWKVKLFPPPVDMRASTSLPDIVAFSTCRWFCLKIWFLKITLLYKLTLASQSKGLSHWSFCCCWTMSAPPSRG